jgi:thioredoxin-related protein
MKTRWLTFALLLSAIHASGEPAAWHDTYAAALAAAKKDGRIVMVVLVAPSRDAQGRDLCKKMREETLAEKRVADLVKTRTAPVLYDLAQLVRKRQKLPQAVRTALGSDMPSTVPVVVFLDGKGKRIEVIDGYAPAEKFLPQLEAAAPAPKADERVERGGKSADDYDDLRIAMDALDAALGGMAGQTKDDAPDTPEARAEKLYEAGQTFERLKKRSHAIRAYSECVTQYPKSDAATKARTRLKALRR